MNKIEPYSSSLLMSTSFFYMAYLGGRKYFISLLPGHTLKGLLFTAGISSTAILAYDKIVDLSSDSYTKRGAQKSGTVAVAALSSWIILGSLNKRTIKLNFLNAITFAVLEVAMTLLLTKGPDFKSILRSAQDHFDAGEYDKTKEQLKLFLSLISKEGIPDERLTDFYILLGNLFDVEKKHAVSLCPFLEKHVDEIEYNTNYIKIATSTKFMKLTYFFRTPFKMMSFEETKVVVDAYSGESKINLYIEMARCHFDHFQEAMDLADLELAGLVGVALNSRIAVAAAYLINSNNSKVKEIINEAQLKIDVVADSQEKAKLQGELEAFREKVVAYQIDQTEEIDFDFDGTQIITMQLKPEYVRR